MSGSTVAYTVALIGTPDRVLGHRAGSVTLDDTTAPHVQGSVDVSIPDAALLALVDPREKKRVRITAVDAGAFGTVTRVFDLGIRSRTVRHLDGYMSLELASDEALLSDYAPMATDTASYSYQASVRSLIGYVLGVAIPGAVLAAGGPDAPIRALIASTNLLANGRAKSDLSGWSPAGGVTLTRYTSGGPAGRPTYVTGQRSSSAGQILVAYSQDNLNLVAGRRYRIGVDQNVDAGTSTAIDAVLFDASGNTLADLVETPQVAPAGWFRRTIEFIAPAGVKQVWVRSFTTGSVAAGRSLNTTGLRLSEVTDDPTDTDYFDADTPDTAEYVYDPTSTGSTRTPLIDRAADLLTWRAGQSALAFLVPIVQALGLRLVCDETRTWTLRGADYTADGSLAIRVGGNLIDGEDTITRDDSDYCDAAVVIYRWRDSAGVQQERVDSWALVTTPTQVALFEKDTPYPGPGFAKYVVQRAQGRGRQVTVTTKADWRARAEQQTEFTLTGAPIQLGSVSRCTFNLDRNEMTVTSRTVDALPSAWLLLPAGQRWIDSPVGGSWTGEV